MQCSRPKVSVQFPKVSLQFPWNTTSLHLTRICHAVTVMWQSLDDHWQQERGGRKADFLSNKDNVVCEVLNI